MRIAATACAALVAATAASASPASAPPVKPLLLKPATGHLGSAGPGEPAIAITGSWGPADLTANTPSGKGTMMIWLAGKTAWAAATFDDPAQEHASSLFYRGLFRTARSPATQPSRSLAHACSSTASNGSPR